MSTDKEFFVITRLSRADIQALIDQEILPAMNLEEISDEMMERIAGKMADTYTETIYWDSLASLVKDMVLYD